MKWPGARAARIACAAAAATVAVACSSSSSSPPPAFSLTQLSSNFSALAHLRPLVASGQGRVAVLLPLTASDRFFHDVVMPQMKQALAQSGLSSSQYQVLLSAGNGQYNQAKQAIADGATVLIVDARYSGEGADIEALATRENVTVIDYDWLNTGGSASYYVGYDSTKVGVLEGEGLVSCAAAWGVSHPRVLVMQGDPNDYNAPVYAQGYRAVLDRQSPAGWQQVIDQQGTWNPSAAATDFQQRYRADRKLNAALIPNDENAQAIIQYLISQGIKPKTFPTTGLDATTAGLQNILAGYQCGTVYKPIDQEVEAAVALSLYVRAGLTFPALLNQSISDQQTNRSVRAVLLTPEWVTTQNMRATVLADGWVTASDLCDAAHSAACKAAGIPG
jgi:D-xylose transport system substrate-binding protein